MSKLRLYTFYVDCGRSGSLDGLFAATAEEIDAAMGKEAYFDEPLGKFSEVAIDLSDEHIKEILISSEAVEQIVDATGRSISGFNPLDHIQDF
jgi:hypothetical protein